METVLFAVSFFIFLVYRVFVSLFYKRGHPIITADALFSLSPPLLLSLFLFHFPVDISTRFSRGNKRDRLETLTHCAEWSQFAFNIFLEI